MDIREILAEKGSLVDKEIEKIIPRTQKPKEVYGLIWDFLDRKGKRFRPALCLLSCEAVGGNPKDALPAAVAVELFHNFSLIHDDIADFSLLRRGKPCLHITYGMPLALNAGDGLFMMVWKPLLKIKDPKKSLKAQEILLHSFTSVLEGQAIELNWHRKKTWALKESDYLKMVGGKTGALVSGACEVGAFLGGAGKKEQRALADFGMKIGIAFQIQDDILNLVGEGKKYRKEIGGDIREGKRTLIVLHALSIAKKREKNFLIKTLDSGVKERQKIERVLSLFKKYSSIEYAKERAREIANEAKEELKILKKSDAKEKLLSLADFLITRDY